MELVYTLIEIVVKSLVVFIALMLLIAYNTLFERKVLGHIQVRYGPNRVGPFGLLQPFADGWAVISNIKGKTTLYSYTLESTLRNVKELLVRLNPKGINEALDKVASLEKQLGFKSTKPKKRKKKPKIDDLFDMLD